MSDAETRAPGATAEADATLLHLNRFAHGAPDDPKRSSSESSTELIRRAAAEAVAGNHRVIVPPRAAPLTADELLGAVAYCYVKGVFSSADIEAEMLRDVEFREALAGVVPDPKAIRRFRRLNREAIQFVLEKFYAHLRRQNKRVREIRSELAAITPARTGEIKTNTAFFVKRKAADCLEKAIFVDGMSDY